MKHIYLYLIKILTLYKLIQNYFYQHVYEMILI